MRIGMLELLVILVAGLLLLGVTLVIVLRRRRPQAGFPVLPPAPSEAEESRTGKH